VKYFLSEKFRKLLVATKEINVINQAIENISVCDVVYYFNEKWKYQYKWYDVEKTENTPGQQDNAIICLF
jgi:hypothetical protein